MPDITLLCLIIGAPFIPPSRKFCSGLTRGQSIVYWIGITMYLMGLCFYLGAFLWKAREYSTTEVLERVFFKIQDSYTGLGGMAKIAYLLSALCYLSVLVIHLTKFCAEYLSPPGGKKPKAPNKGT